MSRMFHSFAYAINGIRLAIWTEKNMRIHLFISVLVIGSSIFFSINKFEWLLVLLVIGGMFSLEIVNSAIERVVNLVTTEQHPLAKQAKDLAAGAVLIYAILAVVIGIIIFFPRVLKIFSQF